MDETIQKILEAAVEAPSGENAQPWKFKVRNREIELFNIPERDLSLYNFQQRGSLIALGTVVENICIASQALGFEAAVRLFPDAQEPNLVALISLQNGVGGGHELHSYIFERSTNRKPYIGKDIPLDLLSQLQMYSEIESGGRLIFTIDKEKIKELAGACSINERVMLENRQLHDFFFSHLNWTEEEEQEKRLGFYIKTLELDPPARASFKIFKHWPLLKILNKLGVSKMAAKQNAKIYATAPAMGIIVIKDTAPKDFVWAGRLMQRLWLRATKFGLSIQPLTGVIFFMQRILGGEGKDFSAEQVTLIKEAYQKILKAFNHPQENIAMMFRIGYADPPSAKSLKLPPIIEQE